MKKLFPIIVSLLLMFSLAPFAYADEESYEPTFKDVPESYKFFEDIELLTWDGVISGYKDGTFRPNQSVTREQAAIMIGRWLDYDGKPQKTIFPDVSPASVASGYIQEAVNDGIIQGFKDGTFRPTQTVTRGQMAIFLSRAFDLTEADQVTFKDVSPSSAAYPYIGKLIHANITYGYEDGTFKPNLAVTRGQFAAFMNRAIEFELSQYYDEDWSDEDMDFDQLLEQLEQYQEQENNHI
ncbi:S-layer homology domain-containing protein [Bacillus testis]|uniref:S-layer homology domain-containing protein n=1 Tax=Bacillus testis TaxID=1622072 RepID=UPI00067EE2B6|nr:S-layer homology domain-containing protein [Bacillus testis]